MSKYYIIPNLNDCLVFQTAKDAEDHILDNLENYLVEDVDEIEDFFYDNIEQVVYEELTTEQQEYLEA